jgi:D-amino-acid dehydrogenase
LRFVPFCSAQPQQGSIVGGIHHQHDWFGDAHRFCTQIEGLCSQAGVDFKYNTTIVDVLLDKRCE